VPVPLLERARRWCLVGLVARPGPHQLAPRGRGADVCVDVGPACADVDQTAIGEYGESRAGALVDCGHPLDRLIQPRRWLHRFGGWARSSRSSATRLPSATAETVDAGCCATHSQAPVI